MQIYESYGRTVLPCMFRDSGLFYPISRHLLVDPENSFVDWMNPTERLWFSFRYGQYNLDAGNQELCDAFHELGQVGVCNGRV